MAVLKSTSESIREDYRNFVGHPSNTEEDNHEDQEQLFVSLYE